MENKTNLFRLLPAVDTVLMEPAVRQLRDDYGQTVVTRTVRQLLDELRDAINAADQVTIDWLQSDNFLAEFCAGLRERLQHSQAASLRPVFNLTGTVIHTNLGRARLPEAAIAALALAASRPTNLEYDLDTGGRGDRDAHIEGLLCEITGAEAATVVNNNAAAVVLVLNTLAAQRKVLISRGELVEIGGSFRIPDVMRSANCLLHEVGTTNRTHLKDYENVLNEHEAESLGAIMKVHTSNYEIKGFTNTVSEKELATLARDRGLPFVNDLGSGTLVDFRHFDLPREPTVSEALEAGADVVTFSGDKLLGGPQAGLIVGRRELIQQIKDNPLKRALRVDKLIMAALAEVLALYRDPDRLAQSLPVLADLTRPLEQLDEVANRIAPALQAALGNSVSVSVVSSQSQVGSGALPTQLIDSRAVQISATQGGELAEPELQAITQQLRQLPVPVIGRVHNGSVLLDVRCLRQVRQFIGQLS